MIRNEVANQTELGKISQPFLETGDIVPDDIAIRLIERKIAEHKNVKGFIFKGFPSTLVQAYILGGLLKKRDTSVSLVIEIKTDTILSIKRLTSRGKTGSARSYDKDIDTIIHRLEVFNEKSSNILDFYRQNNKLISIDGNVDPETLHQDLSLLIEKAFKEIRK